MKILGLAQNCLRYVGLGSEQTILIAGKRVPRAAIRGSVVISQLFLAGAYLSMAIQNWSVGLYAILFPLHLFLMVITKMLIYVVLLAKANQIAESIDSFQSVVDMRKLFVHFAVVCAGIHFYPSSGVFLFRRHIPWNAAHNSTVRPLLIRLQPIRRISGHLCATQSQRIVNGEDDRLGIFRFGQRPICNIVSVLAIHNDTWRAIGRLLDHTAQHKLDVIICLVRFAAF